MTNDHEPMTNETALRDALALAANRLARCALDQEMFTEKYYQVAEWGEEARAAAQSPSQPVVAEAVERPDDWLSSLPQELADSINPLDLRDISAHPQASPPPVQGEVNPANFPTHADDCEAMLRPRADCTCVPTVVLAHSQPDTQEGEVEAHEIDDIIEAAISEGMEDDDWTAFSIARRVHEGLAHNGLAVTTLATPQHGDAAQQQEQQP